MISLDGQNLGPGSGGLPAPIGPLVLSREDGDPPVRYLDQSHASALCGRRLDWVEALR